MSCTHTLAAEEGKRLLQWLQLRPCEQRQALISCNIRRHLLLGSLGTGYRLSVAVKVLFLASSVVG